MERIPKNQLAFVDVGNTWTAPEPVGEPPELERKLRPPRIITFSQIEKIIYEQNGVESKGIFNANLAIGTTLDYFIVPGEFIYGNRADYCFPQELYPEWELHKVFGQQLPTAYSSRKADYLELLERHRERFTEKPPLRPEDPPLERWLIKQRLIPLWDEVAQKFKLPALALQHVMDQEGNFLLPSGHSASEETVKGMAQRIIVERFDSLVKDEPNYNYIAKPDFLIPYIVDGEEYSILVQPDYIKTLKTNKKSVKERERKDQIPRYKSVVAKRIVGDFKDSEIRDLFDPTTAYGKSIRLYNWLLTQIGQRLRRGPKDKKWITFTNGQGQYVFILPSEEKFPAESIQTALEFLREDVDRMYVPLPTLSPEDEELAKQILEETLLASQQSKLVA